MTKNTKSTIIVSSLFVASIGLIAAAPFSRLVYSIWDASRTNKIVDEMIAKENGSGEEVKEANRKAFLNKSSDGYTIEFLLLIDDTQFQLNRYERNETSTTFFYATRGNYTLKNNIVTIDDPSKNVSGILYKDGSFGAGNNETARKEIYDGLYSSTNFALQSDGTFVNGGTSDTKTEIASPAEVYYLYDGSSRPTYKAIALFDNNNYVATSLSLNSKNNEEMAGSFLGTGTYEVKSKDVVPTSDKQDEKYDALNIKDGYGYSWASNNGSLMGFDCIATASYNQWWMMNLSGTATAETRVSKTGYSYSVGAKKETFSTWSLSFVDTGSNDTPETPVGEYPVRAEVETSVAGKPFILEFNDDGTLKTGWTNYYDQTVKTLSWKMSGDEFLIDVGDSGYTFTPTWNDDGSLTMKVNFGQMGDKIFEYTAAQAKLIKEAGNPKTLASSEVASSIADKPFVLQFKDDGTLLTGWTNYDVTMKTVSWKIEGGNLVIDPLDSGYTFTITDGENGAKNVNVVFGQMGPKDFTLTAAQLGALKGETVVETLAHAEVASSIEGKPFIFEVKDDGSILTGWTNYDVTMKTLTWEMKKGKFVVDTGDSGYTVTITDGENGVKNINVVFGQMGPKDFTLTAEDYAKITATVQTLTKAEVASSIADKPFIFEVKEDGSISTGWTNYEVTMKTLTWEMKNGQFVVDAGDSGYTITITDGENGAKNINVVFGQMGPKDFVLSSEEYAKITATVQTITRAEVASSIADKPFIFEVKDDGSILTGWTNYDVTMKTLTWEMKNGQFVVDAGDSGYTVTITDGENGVKNINVVFGQMGPKDFVLSAEEYAKITATVKLLASSEVASSIEGKPFVLQFNDDGSLLTGWTNYEVTMKTVSWKIEGGNLVIDPLESGYTFTITDGADGAKNINVVFGQMGPKDFTLTAAQLSTLLGE